MPTPTTYAYSIANDCPGGEINTEKLHAAIETSSIVTALAGIDTNGDVMTINFKDALSTNDRTILDNNANGPAGGLIASTDNSPSAPIAQPIVFAAPQQIVFPTSLPTWPKPAVLGDRLWDFTHDFSMKTTWYADSIRVVDEAVGTGDGATTTFGLDNENVIDVTHGEITNEDYLVPSAAQGGDTYALQISVNGTSVVERTFQESNGDYTLDHTTGAITFFTPPANGAVITATYFYSPENAGSTIYFAPPAGKKMWVTAIELMFADDIVLTDEIVNAVFTYNPEMGAPPAKFEYPKTRVRIKRSKNLLAWSSMPFPQTQPFGGTNRGHACKVNEMHIDYKIPMLLDSAYGSELRIWLAHHIPLTGTFALATVLGAIDS